MEKSKELTEALGTIDDIIDRLGKLIISIAHGNKDCLLTAHELYRIMRKYAHEDDADRIYEEFKEITGRYIDD